MGGFEGGLGTLRVVLGCRWCVLEGKAFPCVGLGGETRLVVGHVDEVLMNIYWLLCALRN
jgi:hypothetical protein